MDVGRRKTPKAAGVDVKRPRCVIIRATYIPRNEGLLQTQDLRSAYDAPQRQKPLRDRHLDRFHEAAPVEKNCDGYTENWNAWPLIPDDTQSKV